MSDFIQRIEIEKKELDEKISKLQTFILTEKFASLDNESRLLMQDQLTTMKKYSLILQARLYKLK